MFDAFLLQGAILAAAIVSGLTGFGFALVAAGLLFHLREPADATALILASSLIAQILSLMRLKRLPHWYDLWPFLLGGVIGAPLGSLSLALLDPSLVRVGVGLFLLGYSLNALSLPTNFVSRFASRPVDGLIGFVSGILGGIAGLSGAVITAWCLMRGWEPVRQRATFQSFILVMQAYAFLTLATLVGIAPPVWGDLLVTLPVMIVGVMVGLWLFSKLDAARFRRLVLGLLLVLGISLIVSEIWIKMIFTQVIT